MATVRRADQLIPPAAVREDRRRVGVLYHPRVVASQVLARRLVEVFEAMGAETDLLSAWDEPGLGDRLADLDWVVSMGGDGSLVRTARLAAPHGVPILGVNFGRLGFLSELEPDEALARIPEVLTGVGWLDRRLMLRCTARVGGQPIGPIDAVNDVFVGRGATPRAVRLHVGVNGVPLVQLTADGLLVATPTGSTAYSLSAGGPIVAPDMEAMLLTPVAPHPASSPVAVLPASTTVQITVETNDEATLSIDGHIHYPLSDADSVGVEVGPHRVQLLRLRDRRHFYATAMGRLRRW